MKLDGPVKSQKFNKIVIPAKAGIQESRIVTKNWTPVFTGVTTFYDFIKLYIPIITCTAIIVFTSAQAGERIGQYSANPYGADSTSNPYSSAGSPYSSRSINNPYGEYGSPYSAKSTTNPYATDAPKLYDSQGNYRGRLSSNPYDPDSVSNPYGRYGSPYSSESIKNPYGAGSPYRSDSPNNPYGEGLEIIGDE